jgi:hypothetical protein
MRNVLPRAGAWGGVDCIGKRFAGRRLAAVLPAGLAAGACTDCGRRICLSVLKREVNRMKIVIWKSPKYLRGILCKLFHVT